jgi:hypothetical protein
MTACFETIAQAEDKKKSILTFDGNPGFYSHCLVMMTVQ